MYRSLLVLTLFGLLISCAKPEDRTCFKGTGEQVSEERSLGYFHSLSVWDLMDIRLIQDSTDHVVVRCGENILGHVTTEVENGVLTIRDENKCNWLRTLPVNIEVDVHFTEMRHVRNEGSGTLTTVGQIIEDEFEFHNWRTVSENYINVSAEVLTVQLHGGGAIVEVQGDAEMTFYYNLGRGKLLAEELISTNIWADNKSEGEIRCSIAGGTFWYMLDGQGSTYYAGEAQEFIEVSRLGEGDLVPLD